MALGQYRALKKVEIWSGETDPSLTNSLTDFERKSYSAPEKKEWSPRNAMSKSNL